MLRFGAAVKTVMRDIATHHRYDVGYSIRSKRERAMTITNQDELDGLKEIGRIVANTMQAMAKAMEPGMTTRELDEIGRALLEREGALSAPQSTYDFPGATCISVNEEIAHGIPGDRVIAADDLVNIDVSASKNGYFADTGATYRVAPVRPSLDRLCRDGRQAMQIGIAQVGSGRPLAGIGRAIGKFAERRGYTLIRNLASHGIGRALHEEPAEIPTWPARGEKRRIHRGLVLTVEPFLSRGGLWATEADDGWTLYSEPRAPVVQYEHTVVATDRGAMVVTLPG
ncbi:methionine aminopeptidase [Paracoccus kondratievae]|nr:methionine aminopeptidase [Paracoccus kondratievae]